MESLDFVKHDLRIWTVIWFGEAIPMYTNFTGFFLQGGVNGMCYNHLDYPGYLKYFSKVGASINAILCC